MREGRWCATPYQNDGLLHNLDDMLVDGYKFNPTPGGLVLLSTSTSTNLKLTET